MTARGMCSMNTSSIINERCAGSGAVHYSPACYKLYHLMLHVGVLQLLTGTKAGNKYNLHGAIKSAMDIFGCMRNITMILLLTKGYL